MLQVLQIYVGRKSGRRENVPLEIGIELFQNWLEAKLGIITAFPRIFRSLWQRTLWKTPINLPSLYMQFVSLPRGSSILALKI